MIGIDWRAEPTRTLHSLLPKWAAMLGLVILFGLGLLSVGSQCTMADTLEVCKNGCVYPTILSALGAAEPGDVVWVRAGQYRESEPVRLRPGVIVRGEDPEHPELTVIRAEGGNAVIGTGRLLTTTCVLEGFTIIAGSGRGIYIQDRATEIIRDNVISGCVNSLMGSAMRIDDEGTAPTIVNNAFIYNSTSAAGGAIYVEDASPLISGNTFINNHAGRDGGALVIRTVRRPGQQAIIVDNEFAENTASAKGGAVYVEAAQPLIRGNHLVGNKAIVGAGICVNAPCTGGQAIIQANWLTLNQADWTRADSAGGAMAILNGSDAHIDGNVLDQNLAGTGDGVYIAQATPWLTNNVLTANGRNQVTVDRASPVIANNTILGMNVTDSSAIKLLGSSRPCIVNNILALGSYAIYGDGIATPLILFNDTWTNEVDYYGVAPGSGALNLDPRFSDLANADFHLAADSPLIDAGSLEDAPLTDFEGEPRPLDGDGDGTAIPDVGADEYKPPPPTATPSPTMTPVSTATATHTATAWVWLVYLPIIRKR
jgi:predicted outer membrane repeat protein